MARRLATLAVFVAAGMLWLLHRRPAVRRP